MRIHLRPPSPHWYAELALSRAAVVDPVETTESFEISSHSVYWETKVLIDAIEEWLYKFELTGTP